MKQSFATALLVPALASLANAKHFKMSNKFFADFDLDTCNLRIVQQLHSVGRANERDYFSSDDQLLSSGVGNVDTYPVMTAGNIKKFPKVTTQSQKIVCESASTDHTTFTFSGQVIMSVDPETKEVTEQKPFSVSFYSSDDSTLKFEASVPDAYDSQDDGSNFL